MAFATFDFPTITSLASGIAAIIAVATILLKGGRILQKVDSLEERFKGFEKKLDDLMFKMIPQAPHTTASASPISLTKIGRDISDRMNASEIFAKYEQRLVALVDQAKVDLEFDIQEASRKVANDELPKLLTEDEMKAAKYEAYDRGLSLQEIWNVFGVLLRDAVFKKRGIPVPVQVFKEQ